MNMKKDYSQIASDESLEKTKKSLEENGFLVEVAETLEDARTKVIDMIPKGSEVFTATSVTATQAGLDKELNESKDYISVRNKFMPLWGKEDKAVEMRRIGSASDCTVGSVHAVTEDGKVVIASATGSQLPNYVYGASHVIWLVGTQNIVENLDDAFDRIENYVYDLEDARALKAYGNHSSINKMLIYRKEPQKRITIVFIKQPVGF